MPARLARVVVPRPNPSQQNDATALPYTIARRSPASTGPREAAR